MSTHDEPNALRWNDATNYAKGDAERTLAVWRLSAGGMTITVHRHKYYAPDAWILSCEPWFTERELDNTDADADGAKDEALGLVREKLHGACVALGVCDWNAAMQAGVKALDSADDGWIPWGGGKCPVATSVNVRIKLRDGESTSDKAGHFYWTHRGDEADIIAYKAEE